MQARRPGERSGPASAIRRWSAASAPWLGLAHLWLVLSLSVSMQFLFAGSSRSSDVGGWLQTASLAWLVGVALSGVVTFAAAVMSGLVVRAARTFAALVTLWMGSAAISALALGGHLDWRAVLLAVACAGLSIGVSVAPPLLSGSSIFAIGASYVWLHLIVLWSNYYSLGSEFTVAGPWAGGGVVPTAVADLPFPDDPVSKLFALVSTASAGPSSGYYFIGLTGNPNLTGNYLAPFLAFMAAFTLRAAIGTRRETPERVLAIAAFVAFVTPGVFLLHALVARTALIAVLVSMVVALWPGSMRRPTARVQGVLAIVLPVFVIAAPPTLSATMRLSLNGRDCVWESWWQAVGREPVWGSGPGTLPSGCGTREWWWHAHNELLQSWSVGGLVGLVSFVLLIAFLTWFALRFSGRDGRALVAVLTCCLVLFGMEVLTPFFENAVALGVATLIAVAGRSLRLMTAAGPRSNGSVSACRADRPATRCQT